jgi:hypothetical protein
MRNDDHNIPQETEHERDRRLLNQLREEIAQAHAARDQAERVREDADKRFMEADEVVSKTHMAYQRFLLDAVHRAFGAKLEGATCSVDVPALDTAKDTSVEPDRQPSTVVAFDDQKWVF